MTNGVFFKCCHCSSEMWLPNALYIAAKASDKITFCCAYGHPQVFRKGESEADTLRRERDRLAQQIAHRDDEIAMQRRMREAAERSAAAFKGQVTRLKQRASAGVCPCCTRSFANLHRHMATKHPTFVTEKV